MDQVDLVTAARLIVTRRQIAMGSISEEEVGGEWILRVSAFALGYPA